MCVGAIKDQHKRRNVEVDPMEVLRIQKEYSLTIRTTVHFLNANKTMSNLWVSQCCYVFLQQSKF